MNVTAWQWIGAAAVAALWIAWTFRAQIAAWAKAAWTKVSAGNLAGGVLLPVVAGAAILFGPQLIGALGTKKPTLAPLPTPSAELQTVAQPLAAKVAAADRPAFALFFAAAADLLERDRGATVKTADHLAAVNHAALNLMFQRQGWGTKYNDLAAQIGEAEGRYLGIFDPTKGTNRAGPIDAAAVTKAADFCRAVAWGCQQ